MTDSGVATFPVGAHGGSRCRTTWYDDSTLRQLSYERVLCIPVLPSFVNPCRAPTRDPGNDRLPGIHKEHACGVNIAFTAISGEVAAIRAEQRAVRRRERRPRRPTLHPGSGDTSSTQRTRSNRWKSSVTDSGVATFPVGAYGGSVAGRTNVRGMMTTLKQLSRASW